MTDRPTVLRMITRLNIGGPARHAAFLTRALSERGFGTELVSGVEAPHEGRIDPGTDVTLVPSLRRPVDPRADARALRAISQLVARRRPDVVHTHLAKAGAVGRLASHRAGVPVVVHTFHGHVLDGYFPGPAARAFLAAERALARRSTALVAISGAIRDELLTIGIGEESRWRVIPLGLELDDLLALGPDPKAIRADRGLPVDTPVVGIVGRLAPIKDHDTFLRAAVRIAAARPDVAFAVVGDGELRARLGSRARQLLGDRVRFTGWVDDLPSLYGALEVVALTSRSEGTPAALIEAAAAGRPAVATRVGGVADVVRDGETGALVAPGDDVALAGEILRVLDDPALARGRGEAARAHVRDRFSACRLADDVAALYEELLGRAVGSAAS